MKKVLLFSFAGLFLLTGIVVYQYLYFYDTKLHVVFCNVGQGDGILITTPNRKHIIVDAGPDNKILSCLSRHMPFWERTINLALITHPHHDHYFGMHYVIDRYITKSFAIEKLTNTVGTYEKLMEKLAKKNIPQRFVFQGDKWMIGEDIVLKIQAPTKEYLTQTSPTGIISETGEFASLIIHLSYNEFDVVLTGDSQAEEVENAFEIIPNTIEVLQLPHHGSKTGLTKAILQKNTPELAIVSVGGKNRYGHPHPTILQMLQEAEIPLLRTDKHGDIEIVSDGKEWGIR